MQRDTVHKRASMVKHKSSPSTIEPRGHGGDSLPSAGCFRSASVSGHAPTLPRLDTNEGCVCLADALPALPCLLKSSQDTYGSVGRDTKRTPSQVKRASMDCVPCRRRKTRMGGLPG
jgi:hypothetical protein